MSLPAWLTPVFTGARMRDLDRSAIEVLGIPGVELMERAARALAEAVGRIAPTGRIVIVCGKGNNGGDGLAAARLLRAAGREVDVLAACGIGEWAGDAGEMAERLGTPGPLPFDGSCLAAAACVVDCILGTGSAGSPRGIAADAAGAIRAYRADGGTVVACDIPSGVDADTGEVRGQAVVADLTVTFHAPKVGLVIEPGKSLAGRVEVADIGLPDGDQAADIGLIDRSLVLSLPSREPSSDKFSAGSVLIVGGSPGLTGAPMLAGLGAARGGAGYVTVALPASLLSASDGIPELMGLGLPDGDGSHCPEGLGELLIRASKSDACVIGPGLGRADGAVALAREICSALNVPVVLDADGLRALSGQLESVAQREYPTVLTPHSGEMAGLLGVERSYVEGHRLDCVRDAARSSGAVVVLKGDDTLVAEPSGNVAVSSGRAPALATAGTGDVLSGLIGSQLARGLDPFTAACAGVLIHAEAGRILGENGVEGVLASDVAAALRPARTRLVEMASGR